LIHPVDNLVECIQRSGTSLKGFSLVFLPVALQLDAREG